MTLDKLREQPIFAQSIKSDTEVREIVDLSISEGIARNVGKHAGGVVIAPGSIWILSCIC